MGLMLHAKGKKLIKQGNYKDALEVLSMGEVSFYRFMFCCECVILMSKLP